MADQFWRIKGDKFRSAHVFLAGRALIMAFLLSAMPVGANSGQVAALVAELLPKAGDSGFAGLAISESRGLSNLADSVTLISGLLAKTIKAADRRDLYVELASIQELLGWFEAAADSWEAAVSALPGQGETAWLLSAAACRLAIGDSGSATALAKAALLTTARPGMVALALLIEAHAMMLAGDLAGALAGSMEVLAIKSSGLETAALALARDASTGAVREGYEKKLQEMFPGRPETYDALASRYSLVHFNPDHSSGAVIPSPIDSAVSVSASSNARQADNTAEAASSPVYYQLGAFRDEDNALLMSSRLVRAGFRPKTVRRESRTGVLSIVYLEAGSDPARLTIALKDAGFESWPLFVEP